MTPYFEVRVLLRYRSMLVFCVIEIANKYRKYQSLNEIETALGRREFAYLCVWEINKVI